MNTAPRSNCKWYAFCEKKNLFDTKSASLQCNCCRRNSIKCPVDSSLKLEFSRNAIYIIASDFFFHSIIDLCAHLHFNIINWCRWTAKKGAQNIMMWRKILIYNQQCFVRKVKFRMKMLFSILEICCLTCTIALNWSMVPESGYRIAEKMNKGWFA